MNKHLILTIVVTSLLFTASASYAGGTAELTIDGGKKGAVAFLHKKHQQRIGDCSVCHSSFPQKQNAIKTAKEKKQLKKMQVMNSICLKCHRDYKRAGKASGPVSCSGCHTE